MQVIFEQTPLHGAFIIKPEILADERGFFARSFCQREFEAHGLDTRVVQCSISYNRRKGTLRGMHFQLPPHAETRLVRCTRGAAYDVILDLRVGSSTFARWVSAELTGRNHWAVYLPRGFAHGFQTLEDDTELAYQMSEPYHPASASGVRWDDPAFGIEWPEAIRTISQRDVSYPDFTW
jgi:dTDP-4-dehydrorhamnose 3,5-epimerase